MYRQFPLLVAALAMHLVWASPATAQVSITISNPGFEANSLSPGLFVQGTSVTGWTSQGDSGVWRPTAASFPNGVPEGVNAGFVNNHTSGNPGILYQQLTATLAQGTYALSVRVGDRTDTNYAGARVRLLAGAVLLAEANSTVAPSGGFVETGVGYTALAGDPLLGQPLAIELASTITGPFPTQTNFDQVALVFTPVPEPTGLVLVGFVSAAFVRAGARRVANPKAGPITTADPVA